MTFDQTIQIWVAIGTWFAGLATLAAVIVSLWLSRRSEKVRLDVQAGLRVVVIGDGSPFQENASIIVTNLGDRAVTVNSIGWAIGKGKARRHCLQPVYGPHTSQWPIELAHGKSATFMVSFVLMPTWPADFAQGFVQDCSERSLKTLRALVHTSVGQTVEVTPETPLLDLLKASSTAPATA